MRAAARRNSRPGCACRSRSADGYRRPRRARPPDAASRPPSPTSTTGQWSLMNRASEVPPEVESSGRTPVSASTARTTRSENGPGAVRKLSPATWKRAAMPMPNSAATASASCSIHSDRLAEVWASLKRIFTVARASAGITLLAGLPVSMRGDRQRRRVEMRRAAVQPVRGEPVEQADQRRQGVVRAVRDRRCGPVCRRR